MRVPCFCHTPTKTPRLAVETLDSHRCLSQSSDSAQIAVESERRQHWTFRQNRSFDTLLSHGLPSRDIIEGGPPTEILDALTNVFGDKISETRIAFAKAREQLGWPKVFPWNA